jgi:hypothetical protein
MSQKQHAERTTLNNSAFQITPVPDWQFWTSAGLAENYSVGEFVTDWSEVPIGLPVVLYGKGLASAGGYVDSRMEDGSALWIRDETWARRLIHRTDGYAVRVVNRWH